MTIIERRELGLGTIQYTLTGTVRTATVTRDDDEYWRVLTPSRYTPLFLSKDLDAALSAASDIVTP